MKPGTFTQMYVQLVFAVKNRDALLTKSIRSQVFEYIGGINKSLKHKSIIVNGISNHVHILIGLNPSVSISDTVYNIKRGSSLFINNEKLCPGHFSWQEGYGAFTYGRSQLNGIYKYIENQEIHHAKETFRIEYISMLETYEKDYDPLFLFDFLNDIS
ncbi:MAG: IS200/IS605 family transposase [Bacteroidales bacterium]|nr:IS200/IS605 family transposase [Bacteroidales bacterium]